MVKQIIYKKIGREIVDKRAWKEGHFFHLIPCVIFFIALISSIMKIFPIEDQMTPKVTGWLFLVSIVLAGIIELIIYDVNSQQIYEKVVVNKR